MSEQGRWYTNTEFGQRNESYLVPYTEGLDIQSVHSIMVMRLPWTLRESDGRNFLDKIVSRNILPIVFSGDSHEKNAEYHPWYYWPTDEFREIGDAIVLNGFSTFPSVVKCIESHPVFGEHRLNIAERVKSKIFAQKAFFCGGDYSSLHGTGEFFYAEHRTPLQRPLSENEINFYEPVTNFLYYQGWQLVPLDTYGISLHGPSHSGEDLDFLFYPFVGKDGATHAVVADAFADRVPHGITTHVISNEEAARGGCNVADCLKGALHISPSQHDASTYDILNEFALGEIIEAPEDYLEGGGGPRCLTSSFSF